MTERLVKYKYYDESNNAETWIDGILVDIVPVLVPSEVDGRIITNIVGIVLSEFEQGILTLGLEDIKIIKAK